MDIIICTSHFISHEYWMRKYLLVVYDNASQLESIWWRSLFVFDNRYLAPGLFLGLLCCFIIRLHKDHVSKFVWIIKSIKVHKRCIQLLKVYKQNWARCSASPQLKLGSWTAAFPKIWGWGFHRHVGTAWSGMHCLACEWDFIYRFCSDLTMSVCSNCAELLPMCAHTLC